MIKYAAIAIALVALSGDAYAADLTFSPSTIAGGSSATQLVITGTGFSTASVVKWGGADGTKLDSVFGNPTQITASVPAVLTQSAAKIQVSVITGAAAQTGTIVITSDEVADGVDLLFGIGSYTNTGYTDYTVTNGVLAAKSLGVFQPQGLAGMSFGICWSDCDGSKMNWKKRLSVFVSAQFAPTSDRTVTAFTEGLGWHLSPYLHVLVGYSLAPVSQPAPGFVNAAAKYLDANPTAVPYNQFSSAAMRAGASTAFDGFPVPANSGTSGFVYSGNVLETKYVGGLFFGVAFPLSFTSHLH